MCLGDLVSALVCLYSGMYVVDPRSTTSLHLIYTQFAYSNDHTIVICQAAFQKWINPTVILVLWHGRLLCVPAFPAGSVHRHWALAIPLAVSSDSEYKIC